MTKYTPGPWRACREGKCACGLIWSIPEDMVVASLYYEKGEKCVAVDSEMWQANMSLIAAAPEMLESLVSAVGWMEHLQWVEEQNGRPGYPLLAEEIQRINQLIMEATGDE